MDIQLRELLMRGKCLIPNGRREMRTAHAQQNLASLNASFRVLFLASFQSLLVCFKWAVEIGKHRCCRHWRKGLSSRFRLSLDGTGWEPQEWRSNQVNAGSLPTTNWFYSASPVLIIKHKWAFSFLPAGSKASIYCKLSDLPFCGVMERTLPYIVQTWLLVQVLLPTQCAYPSTSLNLISNGYPNP